MRACLPGRRAHEFRAALLAEDIDRADREWNSICEEFIVKMYGHEANDAEAPVRGQPLPFVSVPNAARWSPTLQSAMPTSLFSATRLINSARDLRSRLRRWLRAADMDVDNGQVQISMSAGILPELLQPTNPDDAHAAMCDYSRILSEHDGFARQHELSRSPSQEALDVNICGTFSPNTLKDYIGKVVAFSRGLLL